MALGAFHAAAQHTKMSDCHLFMPFSLQPRRNQITGRVEKTGQENRNPALTTDPSRLNVPRARLAPAMISTPGHWASRRRQRGALPAWSLRTVIGRGVFLFDRGVLLTWAPRISLVPQTSYYQRFSGAEGIFDPLPCVKPHCVAGRTFNTLPRLWIPPVARRPCRHIESAEARDCTGSPATRDARMACTTAFTAPAAAARGSVVF